MQTMDETQSGKQAHETQQVIFVVGEEKKEIWCDKALLLSIGSNYFELLFNSRMKEATENRIHLPQFTPKNFDMFRKVIHDVVAVDKDNASTLVPIFHYFGMETHLTACDQAFIEDKRWDSFMWDRKDQAMKVCVQNLEHCAKFNLKRSFDEVWTNFNILLESCLDEDSDNVNAHLLKDVLKVWYDYGSRLIFEFLHKWAAKGGVNFDVLGKNPLIPEFLVLAMRKEAKERALDKAESKLFHTQEGIKTLPGEIMHRLSCKSLYGESDSDVVKTATQEQVGENLGLAPGDYYD